MKNSKLTNKHLSQSRQGLILLVVLGMLAMFSLLAVTYVVASSSSILGSKALRVRDRNLAFDIRSMNATDKVVRQLIRGTANQDSIMFKNNLLADIYGPDPIRSSFGPYFGSDAVVHIKSAAAGADAEQSVNLVKLSVRRDADLNGPLSDLENEYNSRLLTITEGPLAGNTFRIHKYVGFAGHTSQADPNHVVNPNIPAPGGGVPPFLVPWNPWVLTSANAAMAEYINGVQYSVLIDLNEVADKRITGNVLAPDGTTRAESKSVNDWISSYGIQTLFYNKIDTAAASAANMVGYKFLINDAPFNHAGIGLEDVPGITRVGTANGFGNIDSRGLFINPRVSPSVLTNYQYLNDSTLMRTVAGVVGVDTIGTRRNSPFESRLIGASNEGYDVPDYRDAWLAHQSYSNGTPVITPSFHRPEVINHVTHQFGSPSSLSADDVLEMLKLVQASTGRIMNIRFGTYQTNTRFQANNPNFPKLDLPNWNGSNASQVQKLREFIAWQINGYGSFGGAFEMPTWDVDNDGDGVADSIWTDPGLEIVYAPDGRRLRPLMSVLVQDLDSRVNVNLAGDRGHGLQGFETPVLNTDGSKRPNVGMNLPQGFGYGPAEISLNSFFMAGTTPALNLFRTSPNNLSLFDERYGARRTFNFSTYPLNPVVINTAMDRVPGHRQSSVTNGNDAISQVNEREIHTGTGSSKMPGLPLSRRGSVGINFDVFGNVRMSHPQPLDGDPYNYNTASFLNEIIDDPYEVNATNPSNMDDPLGLADLEAVLRRFDADADRLPSRLKTHLSQIPGYDISADINREVTTRSAELRHPPIAAALKSVKNFNGTPSLHIESGPASYMRYIQMLHSQRYRTRTVGQFQVAGGNVTYSDDPELTYAAISELFPVEFSKGLRMDLNRPFGNGFDTLTAPNSAQGDIDEPYELAIPELEMHPGPGNSVVSVPASFPDDVTSTSTYGRELKATQTPISGGAALPGVLRTRLAGRQILARNLYCLAQLIVPRNYDFPGMDDFPMYDNSGNIIVANAWPRARIRARNLAQWAVNVVDYRDADSAMTRFEYDILPFGVGSQIGGPAAIRPPYWAPDHITETVNGVPNRVYCDVVWGLEVPELLLTESFAYHNKNLRDTSIDANGASRPGDASAMNRDETLDQFRFMDAGLLLEIYNPRSVSASNDPTVAGTSGALYKDVGGMRELNLAALAPAPGSPTPWGRQPVWRIALSEQYTEATRAEHPQVRLEANELQNYTLQSSFETATGADSAGTASLGWVNGANVEQRLGNGLVYQPNHADMFASPLTLTATTNGVQMPVKFDRFIWFTNQRPGQNGMGERVPDLSETDVDRVKQHVYSALRPTDDASLGGTSYMVIGPKAEINFGSLTNNKFTNTPFPALIEATNATDFQFSPSYQRFSLAGGNFVARNLVNHNVNAPFLANSKAPRALICRTDAPSADWEGSDAQKKVFFNGVGINVSLPTPISGENIWQTTNAPTQSLNSRDGTTTLPRIDDTPGFSDVDQVPIDSWVDLSTGSGSFPTEPFDLQNPLLQEGDDDQKMYRSGSYENVRAAYLQRLADPTLAYDPVANPYITVDWISIDLTVFNGETDIELDERDALQQMAAADFDPAPRKITFQSRYKTGAVYANTAGTPGVSYLSPRTVWEPAGGTFAEQTSLPAEIPLRAAEDGGLVNGDPQANPSSYFNYSLGQEKLVSDWTSEGASSTTFGYLNSGNFEANPVTTEEPNTTQIAAATTTSDAFGIPLANANIMYRGAGTNMANVFWLDRQFANPLELMMVPRSAPGQLGMEYSTYADLSGTHSNRQSPSYLNSYQLMNPTSVVNLRPTTIPGNNLVEDWANHDSYWAIPRASGDWFADWSLILEFVETQPPFMDANKYFRPDVMRSLALPSGASDVRRWFTSRFLNSYIPPGFYGNNDTAMTRGPSFLAPFHYNSNYVAAGKVNLNTIAFDRNNTSRVLKALEYLYLNERGVDFGPDSTMFAAAFADSRRGYTSTSVVANDFLGGIANPEMDPRLPTRFAGAFVPPLQAALAPPSALSLQATGLSRTPHSVDTTLLRSERTTQFPDVAVPPAHNPPSNDPMLIRRPGPVDQVNQTNAFDRLQRVMRLSNLTTNQSNVFGVWVTVGLFEYDPITGYGDEYQTSTGGVQRDRKFFIIDRTIPVGFKEGEDLNSRKTILLERTLQ